MSPRQMMVDQQRPSRLLSDSCWSMGREEPRRATRHEEDPVIFGSEMLPTPTEDDAVLFQVSEDTLRRMREPLQRIEALMALGADWDSYGGYPLRPGAALHAVQLLAAILANDVPAPSVVPTSTGGVQLEWHESGADLEMEVNPDRSVEVFLQLPNERTWEGPLANNWWALRRFLAYLSSEG